MASKVQGLSKVGEVWHYSLKINGQRFHGSTRAKDLATAKLVLEDRRKQALNGQLRIITRIPTLSELLREWVKVHQKIHSPRHLKNVEDHARLWLLPVLGNTRVDRITTVGVLDVRNRLLCAGRSPVTANNLLRILRLLCGYAIKVQYLERLPFSVKPLRVQRKPRPILGANEIHPFLACLDRRTRNPEIRIMVRIMIGLGLRESEVLGMRFEWFDANRRTYTVGKAKGKEARILPVPEWLWTAIHSMQNVLSPWVFPAADGSPHRSHFCMKAIQKVCKELGLGNITQHRLRATFASLHAEAGTPLTEIQGMLGHKSIQTTMIYVETSLDAKRRAQDALSVKLGLAQ